MNVRHEWKYEISYGDMLALQNRLSFLMQQDSHAVNGQYEIRSLYFDDLRDKALREKINGENCREKFRIRFYHGDTTRILLEKKRKRNGFCQKERTLLTAKEAGAIAREDFALFADTKKRLLEELYRKIQTQGLRPRTIVDYTRKPFVYAAGNVRVTLDYNIRTGIACTDFLNPHCVMVPAGGAPAILEVKWDNFLPSVVQDILQVPRMPAVAVSKYALCRLYG